jgi:heme/copper-type cytochrome/quinol oxidase subunit 3
MTLALPAPPIPEPKRSMLVATGFAVAAGTAFFGSLLGLYLRVRDDALDEMRAAREADPDVVVRFLPSEVHVPEIATNTMLFTVIGAAALAQWAVYAMKRGERHQTAIALALCGIFGLATLNSQAFTWTQMGVGIEESGAFGPVFYASTGAFAAALVVGVVHTAITAFRSLGGRYSATDTEGLTSHALVWYFLVVAYTALWFVIYVNK